MGIHLVDSQIQFKLVRRAAMLSLIAALLSVAVKIIAGCISGSVSVLSEGLHSVIDVLVSLGVLFVVRIAMLPPDQEHPYGHGRAEVLMSAVQMIFILLTAGYILYKSYLRLINPREIEEGWGIIAMVYGCISNALVSSYLRKIVVATRSQVLESEIYHLHTDTLASLGILVGLVIVAITGWNQVDSIVAALFVSIAMYAAIRKLIELVHSLMDGALPERELRLLQKVLDSSRKVRGYHNVRTRGVGRIRYIDLHVMLDDQLSFVEAHDVAEQLEENIRNTIEGAVVSVHYEPYEVEMRHQAVHHQRHKAREKF